MSHAEEQFVAPKDLHLALENCERRYDELLRAVTDYTYTVTVENGVAVKTRHSAACLGVTGFSQEEYEAQPYLWLEMIHLEDRDIVLKQTADILAGQDSSVLEHRIYHKDGSIRWIQNTLFRRYNTNYSLIAYDGLIRDITERKRAEEQVAHAAKEWTNTFDSINDLVSVHDQEFRFIKVNKSLADFLGMNPADLLGKKCFKLIHGQDQPWFDCPHAQVLKTNRTVSAEIADPNLGGTILLITCSPYFDEKGALLGTVHIARDITKQKQLQSEREKLIKDLQVALAEIKTLRGILPVCCVCGLIRDDTGVERGKGEWMKVDKFVIQKTDVQVSHTYCPLCYKKAMGEDV